MLLRNTAIALVMMALPASAQVLEVPSGTYNLDPTHASLHWSLSHFGTSIYVARFTTFDATLELDSDDPTNSKLTAEVTVTSLETDYPIGLEDGEEDDDFDEELRGPEWFDVSQFPKATFASTEMILNENTGDEITGTMNGDLTFMGVTKPISFDVRLVGQATEQMFDPGAAIGFEATTTFARSEFGMDTMVDIGIGDEVHLDIKVEMHEQGDWPDEDDD